MLRFYIALYTQYDPGLYHWALIAVPEGNDIAGPVHVFQIVTATEGTQGEDGFMTGHGIHHLMRSKQFVCAMQLPSLDMSIEGLERYMRTQYAGRRGSPLIPNPNNDWSCFQWAMRALQGLIHMNLVLPESMESLFNCVNASHPGWGTLMHVVGTIAANSALMDPHLIDTSTGVHMMHFQRYRIKL